MLHVVKGDILQSDCTIIIHQANCFATMGAGIAQQIKEQYPYVYEADKNFSIEVGSLDRLGNYSVARTGKGNRDDFTDQFIINMYSQYHYGRGKHTDVVAMRQAMKKIMALVLKTDKVGLPYNIGCGMGGGNWKDIKSLLEEISEEFSHDLYLYIYTPKESIT